MAKKRGGPVETLHKTERKPVSQALQKGDPVALEQALRSLPDGKVRAFETFIAPEGPWRQQFGDGKAEILRTAIGVRLGTMSAAAVPDETSEEAPVARGPAQGAVPKREAPKPEAKPTVVGGGGKTASASRPSGGGSGKSGRGPSASPKKSASTTPSYGSREGRRGRR